ncbi:hypothetical protein Tco_0847899 [Tanacetum coccineum]
MVSEALRCWFRFLGPSPWNEHHLFTNGWCRNREGYHIVPYGELDGIPIALVARQCDYTSSELVHPAAPSKRQSFPNAHLVDPSNAFGGLANHLSSCCGRYPQSLPTPLFPLLISLTSIITSPFLSTTLGMFVTKIAQSFGLLTNELASVLNRESPPHVYRKTSLVKMGVIMELYEGECCWPATREVVEEGEGDDEEGDGEGGNKGVGGSADIYRNMS